MSLISDYRLRLHNELVHLFFRLRSIVFVILIISITTADFIVSKERGYINPCKHELVVVVACYTAFLSVH